MVSTDDIWLVDFGEPFPGDPAFHRPALVVGPAGEWGTDIPFAFVVPFTTTRRELRHLHVEVEPDAGNGLDTVSYAQCEQLRSVNPARLVVRLAQVDHLVSDAVEQAIRDILGY
jgi:mRNA interferase MazF